jgi:hypothetical protein
MKKFILDNFKTILILLSIIIGLYFIYVVFDTYTENKIEKRIKEEGIKIEKLKQEAIYWKTKSEMFEKESKSFKEIIEKSKQNITTIINKYDEKRNSIRDLNDDESIKFLSERLNKEDNTK